MKFRRLTEKRPCPNCGKMYPISQTLHRCDRCGTIYCGDYSCVGKVGRGYCPNCGCNVVSTAVFDHLKGTWV